MAKEKEAVSKVVMTDRKETLSISFCLGCNRTFNFIPIRFYYRLNGISNNIMSNVI